MSSVEYELRELEESMWREETRYDPAHLDRVFHRDFFEFGQSGTAWSRQDMFDSERAPIRVTLPLPDFRVRLIAPDVALVTYRSVDETRAPALRCSLWRRVADGWQMLFHQATPTT